MSVASSAALPPAMRGRRVFTWPVRVYWEDTDAGGIVFYANWLKFLERARTEWLRHEGIGQQRLRETTGVMFVVAATAVRYHRPARLDDLLTVTVDVVHAGRASLQIAQQAFVDGTPCIEADIKIACVDAATLAPARMPDALLQRLALAAAPSGCAAVP